MSDEKANADEKVRKWLKNIFSPIWFGGALVLVGILFWLFLPNITVVRDGVEEVIFRPWVVIVILELIYYISSFRISSPVKSDQIGIKVALGRPFAEVGSGPPFAPLYLVTVQTEKKSFQQREFPAEPDKIWRPAKGDISAKPPEGFKPPVRITFGEVVDDAKARNLLGVSILGASDHSEKELKKGNITPEMALDLQDENSFYYWSEKVPLKNEDALDRSNYGKIYIFNAGSEHQKTQDEVDGLSRRVTAEVSVVLRWRIIQGKGIDYIVNIGDRDNLIQQAEDEMVGILQRLLPNMSVGQAMQNIAWINAILKRKVEARTHDWGVEISGAYVKQIQFHRDLNSAIADRGEAYYIAASEKERIIRKGEGDAVAAAALEIEVLRARAKGYKEIADSIGVSGGEVQASEVARTVGEGRGSVVLGASGFKELVGIAKVLTSTDQKKNQGGGE